MHKTMYHSSMTVGDLVRTRRNGNLDFWGMYRSRLRRGVLSSASDWQQRPHVYAWSRAWHGVTLRLLSLELSLRLQQSTQARQIRYNTSEQALRSNMVQDQLADVRQRRSCCTTRTGKSHLPGAAVAKVAIQRMQSALCLP